MTTPAKPDEGAPRSHKWFAVYHNGEPCAAYPSRVQAMCYAAGFGSDEGIEIVELARTTQCSEVGVTDAMVNAAIQEMDFTWPESREHMRRAIAAALAGRKLP